MFGLVSVVLAAPAAAATTEYEFDLAEQDLEAAVRAIGRQGRVDILFQPETIAGRRSSVVRGRLAPLAALRSALRVHRGLEAVRLPDGTLLVRALRDGPAPLRPPRPDAAIAPPAPAAGGEAAPEQEIVVTATRRPTLLKSYAGSLTVLPGRTVEKQGRASLATAAELVPGLNLTETGAGQRRITMRGVHSAGENSVLLYLDETPVSGPSSATSDVSQMSPDVRLFDVERVEVLRGPQGTLFGSGALGGAVRILFNKPDLDTLEAEAAAAASFRAGGEPGRLARATLNLPLRPGTLALRATGYDERHGGYVDNVALGLDDVDRSRTSGGRLMARFEPIAGYDLTATVLAQRQRVADASGWYPRLGAYRTDNAERLPFPNDLKLYSLTGHARVAAAEVTAAASHYRWEVTRNIDSTRAALNVITNGTYCPLYSGVAQCNPDQLAAYRAYIGSVVPLVGSQPMRVDAKTGEVRVASAPGEPLTLVGGLFFEHRADSSRSGTYQADPVTGRILSPERLNYLRTISVETRQAAIFADVGWRPGASVAVTIGGRRYTYRKSAESQVLQTSYVNGAVAGPPLTRSTDSSGWTGRANLAFEPASSLLVYGQVATGFRPGGVNSVPNLPDPLVAFDADSATTYEAGFRAASGNGDLSISGSAYLTDWHDMQTSARLPSFMFVSNSGAARIAGLDLEAEATPVPGLRLRAAVSLLEARLSRDQANLAVAAPGKDGDRIPFEPSAKAVFSGEFSRLLGDRLASVIAADLAYVGASYSDYRPTSRYYEKMGDYADLTLRWELDADPWTLRFTLANVFNSAGRQRVESTVNSEQLTNSLAPRTLGIEIGWRFASKK